MECIMSFAINTEARKKTHNKLVPYGVWNKLYVYDYSDYKKSSGLIKLSTGHTLESDKVGILIKSKYESVAGENRLLHMEIVKFISYYDFIEYREMFKEYSIIPLGIREERTVIHVIQVDIQVRL